MGAQSVKGKLSGWATIDVKVLSDELPLEICYQGDTHVDGRSTGSGCFQIILSDTKETVFHSGAISLRQATRLFGRLGFRRRRQTPEERRRFEHRWSNN